MTSDKSELRRVTPQAGTHINDAAESAWEVARIDGRPSS